MAIIRCDRGHYYDNTKFSQCPHCGVLPVMETEQTEKPEKSKRFSFFHKKTSVANPVPMHEDDDNIVALSKESALEYDEDDDYTVALPKESALEYDEDDDHTVALPKESALEYDDHTVALPKELALDYEDTPAVALPKESMLDHEEAPAVVLWNASILDCAENDHTTAFHQILAESAVEESTIAEVTESIDKTNQASGFVTELTDKTDVVSGLVVGWLVCIKGMTRGRDYRLYQGFNRISMDMAQNITVTQEVSAGQKILCAVVYDDRSNQFYAVQQPGGTAYLNGKALLEAQPVYSGDQIKIDEMEFEFIAFCREGRVWNVNE